MLDRLSYEGEKRGMDCYLELERFNEPVLETKKVRDLLNRIKAPELAAAKQQVKATDRLANSFEEAANFLALSIVPLKVATSIFPGAGGGNKQEGSGG